MLDQSQSPTTHSPLANSANPTEEVVPSPPATGNEAHATTNVVHGEGIDSNSSANNSVTAIDQVQTSAAVVIDQAKKEALECLFHETINNPRFWEKEGRHDALKAALVIPVFDDRDMQMFFNKAMDDLGVAAARESARTGRPAVLPTEEEGKAEAYLRKAKKEKELLAKEERKRMRSAG